MGEVLIKANLKKGSRSWVLGWHLKEHIIAARERVVLNNTLSFRVGILSAEKCAVCVLGIHCWRNESFLITITTVTPTIAF